MNNSEDFFTTSDYLNIENYYLNRFNTRYISPNMEEQLIKICYNYINLLNYNRSVFIKIKEFVGLNIYGQVNEYAKVNIKMNNRDDLIMSVRTFIQRSSTAYNQHLINKNLTEYSKESTVYDDFFKFINSDNFDGHEVLPDIICDKYLLT